MDYEKMYKAVLKTATQWIKDGCSDKEKICLESIFPELRESEDERIRKALIDGVRQIRCKNGITQEQMLAYLEKQKECVADSSKTSANEDESIRKFLVDYFTSYKIGNVATKLNGVRIDDILNYLEKQKETLHILEMCKENANSFTDGVIEVRSFQRGMEEGRRLEGQKEQKHPNGCFTCDEYKKGYEEGRRNGFTAGYNKAMKEVEQKEQKPVVTLGETYHVDTLGTQQVIAGKMPQKPAEWSEEDEDNLCRVIRVVEDNDSDWKELTDWLKSLRPVSKESLQPHWKPSEEQISGIECAIQTLRYQLNVGDKRLNSLYEDLKKLM